MRNYRGGIVNPGNPGPLRNALARAEAGNTLNLGFIGGSITQGCNASCPENNYVSRVCAWFAQRYPEVHYINAGIGGTTSQFAAARVQEDLLKYRPDIVFVEFSVNDENTPHYRETFEGLIRKILKSGAAAVVIHNVCYDTGASAQEMHLEIAKHYDLPALSARETLYQFVLEKELDVRSITEDDLHPNDLGHQMLAQLVIEFLENLPDGQGSTGQLPSPLTENQYENSFRLDQRTACPVLRGFTPDPEPQNRITQMFRHGYLGRSIGDSVFFHVSGSCIAVQYRKTIHKPAPVALAILDGNEKDSWILDGNFEEDWGDCLYCQTLISHGENKVRTLEIRIIHTSAEDASGFYLASVIQSSKEE